jgi:hypothetical protein
MDAGAGSGGGGGGGTGPVTPPDNLRYWFEADFQDDITYVDPTTQQEVSGWRDHSGNGWDLGLPPGGTPPAVTGGINGLPGFFFGTPTGSTAGVWSLVHRGPSTSASMAPYPFGQDEAHVVYVVCRVESRAPGGTLASSGGMLVTDRDGFARQLWRLSDSQQRIARGQVVLYDDPSVDFVPNYTGKALLVVYQWTGTHMIVTVNGGQPLMTRDLNTTMLSQSFPPVPDDPTGANEVLEVGGSPVDEAGFGGTIEAVLLEPVAMPNQDTIDYLVAKWGPFEPVTN